MKLSSTAHHPSSAFCCVRPPPTLCNPVPKPQAILATRNATAAPVATAVVMAVAFVLPEKTPNILWPLVYSLAIYYHAQQVFGSAFEKHMAGGGAKGPWWRVVWMSLLFLVVVVGVLFGVLFLHFWLTGDA